MKPLRLILLGLLGGSMALPAWSFESSLTLELEARGFVSDDLPDDQFDSSYSVRLEPEVQNSFNEGNTIFSFTPFYRWDSEDDEREHFDVRELNIIHVMDQWELLFGVSKVFWGVAESSHLVDIINQTDELEGIDGEDKLGQPMIRLSHSFEQSVLSGFVLPGFRKREFLSPSNPLSLPFAVNNDPLYESGSGDDHVDYALRYSGYRGIVDYGVSWFHGASREPDFVPGADGRLRPYYPLIDQLGVDIQATSDAWLWKLESIRRTFSSSNRVSSDDFTATVGGFEYSIYGLRDGLFDLGLLLEYNHDTRDDPGTAFLQNDLFLGSRFGFNDAESSEVLAGVFLDLDDDTSSFRLEGNRRVFNDARFSIEAQAFSNVDAGNVIANLQGSAFIQLTLEWFF